MNFQVGGWYIKNNYLLGRKCIFVQPLLAFKVKDGLKIWTKFIEKIKIRQWQPNSELI